MKAKIDQKNVKMSFFFDKWSVYNTFNARFCAAVCLFLMGMSLLVSRSAVAQETPPLVNYPSAFYKAHNQNWSVAQSSDHLIYAANSDGLLEFDGASWKTYPLPDRQIVRSVLCDDFVRANGKIQRRVYVGGFAEFGYWNKEADGKLSYHSLSKIAQFNSLKTEEIWHIFKTPERIYFQSFSHLYSFDGKTIREIRSPGNFMFIRPVHGQLLVQLIGKGLFELKDNRFLPIAGTDVLAQTQVSSILPLSNGGALICTSKHGLFILDHDKLSPWIIPISDELKTNLLNTAVILSADSSIAFGTIQKGIYVVSSDGQLKYQFNKDNGLQNNTVLALGEDGSRNLWTGLDQGIDLIKMSSPVISYQINDNPLGTTYAAAIWRGDLYVGSNNGVFVKKWNSNEVFRPIRGLEGQTWSLNVINDQLLCGHNEATFRIDKHGPTRISQEKGGWVLLPIVTPIDTLLLQGSYNGLHVYRRNQDKLWTYAYAVKGIPPLPIKQIVQDKTGAFWLRHAYKGLYRTTLTPLLDSALSWREYKAPADVPNEFSVEIAHWRDKIRVSSGPRFFTGQPNGTLVPDHDLPDSPYKPYKLRPGIDGDWFMVYPDHIAYTGNRTALNIDLSLVRNNENIIPLSERLYFFCLDNGYALFNRFAKVQQRGPIEMPVIRSVANLRNPAETFDVAPSIRLSSKVRSIRITFSLPVYGQTVQYQYRLRGLSDQWSQWSEQNFVEFTNLASTDYTFEIKSNLHDGVSAYQFMVAPYWYETVIAKISFGLLLICLIAGAIFYQEKRLLRHRRKLLEEQEEKLRQQQLSSERKIMEIQNEKLQSEIKSKSQQISNVAINVVRKNEILEEIRDELMQVKQEMGQQLPNIHYQKLLHSIERNVAGKEDWLLFEENFHEVHEEFFTRLRHLCPSISPSELRLAACLRMNLSTKEMAPALGISTRGVEIKRYRLRKKLGLDNETNLSDFMMDV
jgi:DNA-binding CsgD family transcriptional regulator